jgi:CheY-like chemotaxis protein
MRKQDGAAGKQIVPLSILVVNDDPMLLELFVQVLEMAGHRVTAACGGLEAIEAGLSQGGADLLIADIETRSKNGHRAAAALNQRPGLRVLYITGTLESLGAQLNTDNRITLQKPFSPSELLAAIGSVMETAEPSSRTGEPSFADRSALPKQRSLGC